MDHFTKASIKTIYNNAASIVISIPSVRKGESILLHRLPVDYEGAETIHEKELIHEKLKGWLMAMYCREIWCVGKEPVFYVEVQSRMETEDDPERFDENIISVIMPG